MTDANLVEFFCMLSVFCKYLELDLKKRDIQSYLHEALTFFFWGGVGKLGGFKEL
jgi:hypothetical protein